MTTQSQTIVTYPIVTAITSTEQFLGPHRTWQPVNEQQTHFLKTIFEPGRVESASIPEIESIASRDAQIINTFLRERGFDIQLQAFPPDGFGTASVLDLLVEWLQPGTATTLRTPDQKTYPAARLTGRVRYSSSEGHPHPIATISTKSGDEVSLTISDQPYSEFALISKVEQLTRHSSQLPAYGGLVFPMVDLNHQVNIDWLLNMQTLDTNGSLNSISQALQQTKLRMNETGARVESAVAVAVRLSAASRPKPDMIIDRPFLIWFTRPHLQKPLFVGYITPQNWKKPETLT